MKKYLFPALALGLLLTSCQSDEPFAPGEGGEKQVTFTLNVPGELGTRADENYNSGVGGASNVGAANIKYTLVLDANGDTRVFKDATVSNDGRTATFTPTVVLGRNYTITAYASFDDNSSIDEINDIRTISVSKKFNDESKDAYFQTITHNFAEGDLQPLTLRRPFGKLRLVATDYKADGNGNTAIKSVKVKYNNNVFTTFNAVSGEFSNGQSYEHTLDGTNYSTSYYAPEKDENGNVIGQTIFADYVPVNSTGVAPFEITIVYVDGDEEYTRKFNQDIPVRRNALTTLKGNFFTAGAEITVKVEDAFDNNSSKEYDLKFTANEVQAALDAAPAGETTTIYLGATIEGDVIEYQKADRHVIIDGMGNKWNGTIKIHNGSDYNNGEITVKKVNFETSDAERNFIEALENGSERYSNNITVDSCTFTSPATRSSINEGVVGVQVKSSKNVKVLNCKANNIHSLLQAQSCDENVIVKDAKINGCKNGVAFKAVKKAVVEGCEINVAGYGIRFDGNQNNYGITVKDNNVTAKQPFIVRKMTGQNNTIDLEGENTLTATADYQIVITNGNDDAEYVKPTGTYTLNGADNFTIFPKPLVAKVGNTEYDDIKEAIASWTNNTTLTLLSDVTLNDVVTLKSTEHHILDLGTYTMTAAEGKNAFVIQACGTGDAERTAITIKADANNPGGINAGNKCIVYYKYADGGISVNDRPIIKIEGGVFTGSTSSWGTAGIYTIGSEARKCATLNISGGTFNCSINGSTKSKLLISGGTFNYSVGSQGDSTALRLISGGKFKTLGFMTADSNNTKFWFGTSMGNSNVGLYIDDDNYLVVGGPVITEFGDKFAAKATNATKWSSYLQYSSAAANGLYYTNAEKAIEKHGAANVVLK